jgi:hypothetical protein
VLLVKKENADGGAAVVAVSALVFAFATGSVLPLLLLLLKKENPLAIGAAAATSEAPLLLKKLKADAAAVVVVVVVLSLLEDRSGEPTLLISSPPNIEQRGSSYKSVGDSYPTSKFKCLLSYIIYMYITKGPCVDDPVQLYALQGGSFGFEKGDGERIYF